MQSFYVVIKENNKKKLNIKCHDRVCLGNREILVNFNFPNATAFK